MDVWLVVDLVEFEVDICSATGFSKPFKIALVETYRQPGSVLRVGAPLTQQVTFSRETKAEAVEQTFHVRYCGE